MENLKLDNNHIVGYIFIFFLVSICIIQSDIKLKKYWKERKGIKEANRIYETVSSFCNREKKGVEKTYYCKNGLMSKDDIKKIVKLKTGEHLTVKIYDFDIILMIYNKNGTIYELSNGKMEKS